MVITVEHLTKIYKSPLQSGNIIRDFFSRRRELNTAVHDISFSINNPELVGFIGPNGAGKTTTMKILAGILYPSKGMVQVLGHTPFDKKKEFLRNIAFIMGQKNQLLWDLPPTESFRLNQAIYEVADSPFKKTVADLSDLLDCHGFLGRPVRTLSLGQRMRVELVAALIHQPKVLFLDEPTIGLDIFAQTIITDFIKEYQEKYKATIILTSHYMKDIQRLAKRIIMINRGRILFDDTLEKLTKVYSQEKKLRLIVKKPVEEAVLKTLTTPYEYRFPLLTISIKKRAFAQHLLSLLGKFEFSDLTLEDEPIEEVVKKVFAE